MKKIDVFSTWTPLDLTKAKEDDGSLEIEGIASSESVDESGEIILQDGLDFSYALKKGVFNLEHLSGPKNVLGHPSKVYSTSINGKKATAVKGILYTKKKEVAEIIETAKAMKAAGGGRTLGFSIEGSVLARDPRNPKIITRAKVLNISITSSPCNADATMKLVKSIMADMPQEELNKGYDMKKDNEYYDKPMTLKQAKIAAEYAQKLVSLLDMLPDDVDLPEWIQGKVAKSFDYLQAAYHYLDVESKEMIREYKSYKEKYEKMLEEKPVPQPEEGEPTPEGPGIHPTADEDNDYRTQDKPEGYPIAKEEGSLAPIVEESLEGSDDEDDDESIDELASEDYELSDEEMKALVIRILREYPELSDEKIMQLIHQYIGR
jgi:hypothetical protein